MDDWEAEADPGDFIAAPASVLRAAAVEPEIVDHLASMVVGALRPALVVGSGTDDQASWEALVVLAERLQAPVWQEPFGARAGFPQDHALFAGHLPSGRAALRDALGDHDLVLVLGAAAFRQYPYEPGELIGSQTRVIVVTDDRDEAYRSPAELVVRARPSVVCRQLAAQLPAAAEKGPALPAVPIPDPPSGDEPMRPAQVFAALAARLPRNTVVVEESPSSRAALQELLPAREPLGFLSAAMGGLGFGMPAAVGVRLASPERPVVAVLGDGSSLYAIQSLWSAAKYEAGVLFVVLANGRYAIMDELARRYGQTTPEGRGAAPWPSFEQINLAETATSLGCPAREVDTYQQLIDVLDEIVATLASRREPLLLNVSVLP